MAAQGIATIHRERLRIRLLKREHVNTLCTEIYIIYMYIFFFNTRLHASHERKELKFGKRIRCKKYTSQLIRIDRDPFYTTDSKIYIYLRYKDKNIFRTIASLRINFNVLFIIYCITFS